MTAIGSFACEFFVDICRFRFAWDWRTPIGFFAASCLQCYWIHCVIIMIIGTISLFAKFCTLLGAIAKDVAWQLDDFNTAFIGTRRQATDAKLAQTKLKLIEIIEFHSVTQSYGLFSFFSSNLNFQREFFLRFLFLGFFAIK